MIGTFSLFLCSVASRHRHHRASSSSSLSSCCRIIIASSSLCVTSSCHFVALLFVFVIVVALRCVVVACRHHRVVGIASHHVPSSHVVVGRCRCHCCRSRCCPRRYRCCRRRYRHHQVVALLLCRVVSHPSHHITARCVVEPSLSLHHRCCRRWVVTSSWSSRCHHIASHRVASSLSPSGRRIVESSSWRHVTRRPCRRVVIIESSCVVAVAAIGHCRRVVALSSRHVASQCIVVVVVA